MSDQAMLYCARKLDIAPPLELRRPSDGKVVQSYNETDWGYLSLVQMSFLCHLELQASLPCGTITVEECFAPELRLYTLFSNYDLKFKTDRARRFKKAKILAILEEIEGGLDGFDGPSPEIMWHWDVKKCGFGYALRSVRQETLLTRLCRYSAPCDVYNIWPAQDNPYWGQDFELDIPNVPAEDIRGSSESEKRGRPRERSRRADTA